MATGTWVPHPYIIRHVFNVRSIKVSSYLDIKEDNEILEVIKAEEQVTLQPLGRNFLGTPSIIVIATNNVYYALDPYSREEMTVVREILDLEGMNVYMSNSHQYLDYFEKENMNLKQCRAKIRCTTSYFASLVSCSTEPNFEKLAEKYLMVPLPRYSHPGRIHAHWLSNAAINTIKMRCCLVLQLWWAIHRQHTYNWFRD